MLRTLPLFVLLPLVLATTGCDGTGKSCTALGCVNGVNIDLRMKTAGAYVFEVTVDGVKTTCRTTLPLPQDPGVACERDDVRLILSGSRLPASEHSLDRIELTSTVAKSVTIRATRDGMLLGESTVSPPYQVIPPPNGPDCEPPACKLASYSFP